MIPSWYDVLDVAQDATTDEIRAAWQEAVAGLDPTDRRFKQRNRAAEVLLDPERRAAHDRDLAAQDDDEDDWDAPGPAAATEVPATKPATTKAATTKASTTKASTTKASTTKASTTKAATTKAATTPAERAGSAATGEAAGTVVLDKASTGRTGADVVPHEGDDTDDGATTATGAGERSAPSRGLVRLTVVLGVLALVLLLATLASLAGGSSDGGEGGDDTALPDTREIAAARKAAETAAGPVLSYDYRDLDKSFAAARSFLTPRFQDVYDQNVNALVAENAPTTKTIVTAEVLGSGVVRTGEGLVDVLVFVNRPTRNASGDSVSRDQVTMRMVDVDDRWLVDCLVTQPGASC